MPIPITLTISDIVRRREQRLPQIIEQQSHLSKVLKQLDELDGLLGVIHLEVQNQQGDYFYILQENPKMRQSLATISTTQVRNRIKEQLEKLDILAKRFTRKTVRIAMIGRERQGKSTFLKTISDLHSDKVIPAYDGTSCTGAVSVIHNVDGPFKVNIGLYSISEFLSIVKDKLAAFFPGQSFMLNSLADVQSLQMPPFTGTGQLAMEFGKFKKAYIDHLSEYRDLLEQYGGRTIERTDENEVVQYVAQYERFDTPPEGGYDEIEIIDGHQKFKRYYYKYVAVKHVDIYQHFGSIESQQIELVDTVGMGDASNKENIEKEMFRVLREDCDAAVDLFKPASTGDSLNDIQTYILEQIKTQLAGREPYKWIVYVINKQVAGNGVNQHLMAPILEQYQTAYGNSPEEERPVAWAKAIDGSNNEDVQDNLIVPLLEMISQNLDSLDDNLMKDAIDLGTTVYSEYFSLRENVEKVLSGAAKKGTQEGSLFDEKMDELKETLFPALRKLDEENYQKKRNKPCPEVANSLEAVIEGLYDVVPDEQEIIHAVDMGVKGISGIFSDFCNDFYNSIYSEFENVSDEVIVPLREVVKMDMIKLMYDTALLGHIPLRDYSIQDGPSPQWLECLLKEKVRKDIYPEFYETLNYILTYNFNIEDTIEYDVSQCVGIIDQLNTEEFIPFMGQQGGSVEERANSIWQELANRISPLQVKLRKTINRFALIPSHSFSTRVQKFRFKIVWGKEVSGDMREFYRDNCYALWKDFANIEGKAAAFGKWNKMCEDLAALCQKDKFILSIKIE